MERYKQKPLYLIAEQYTLSLIGELSAEDDAQTRELVKEVFGGGDDWQHTFRERLKFHELDPQIIANWEQYQANCRAAGETGSPRDYAVMFVDAFAKGAESHSDCAG